MRGGQGRQPLDVPSMERVRQHCVFARMPGVFEPCTRLDHLVVAVPCLSNPAFSASRIARKLLGDGSVWILVTSGIIEQLNPRLEPAWFPSLLPVVMHSPVTGLFRVLLDRFLLHPSPLPSNVRLGCNRLSIQHCNVWSDGLLR